MVWWCYRRMRVVWCYRRMCGVVVLQADESGVAVLRADESGVAVLQADESGVAVLQVVVTRTRGACYLIPTPDGLNFASAAAAIASRNVSVPASTPRHLAFCSHTSLSAATLRFPQPHFAFRSHTSLSASTLRFLHPHFALSIPVCFLHPHFAFCMHPVCFLYPHFAFCMHPHFASASTPPRKCSLMNW